MAVHEFSVTAIVEVGTKSHAESKGWNVEAAVQEHIKGMEALFNNGQLAATYRFKLLGIKVDALDVNDPGYPPGVDDTPEQDDFVVVYDSNDPGNNRYLSGSRTIVYKGGNFAPSQSDMGLLFAHEFGHGRGCIDIYHLFVAANEVFPGALYTPPPSIMGVGVTSGSSWDDLSVEMINEAAGDPKKDVSKAVHWIDAWTPGEIELKIVDQLNAPVANSIFKIYRESYSDSTYTIRESGLWHEGLTDLHGVATLPGNPATHGGGFFGTYLLTVKRGGDDYLKWFTVADIAVPYRRGSMEHLVLEFVLGEGDRYVPPAVSVSDVAAQELAIQPATLHHFEPFANPLTITNHGPDAVAGQVVVQFWGSMDQVVDKDIDVPLGGYGPDLTIQPGKSVLLSFGGTVPPSMPAGEYYLLAEVKHTKAGAHDPDLNNNIASSPSTFTVSP